MGIKEFCIWSDRVCRKLASHFRWLHPFRQYFSNIDAGYECIQWHRLKTRAGAGANFLGSAPAPFFGK